VDLNGRCSDICIGLSNALSEYRPNIVAVCYEQPQNVGHVADLRGDIVKLTTLCGFINNFFYSALGCAVVPVRIVDWKGQLPKEVTKMRVERYLKKYAAHSVTGKKTSHEYDAIGIGMHKIGVL
jgi:hypothetical protein